MISRPKAKFYISLRRFHRKMKSSICYALAPIFKRKKYIALSLCSAVVLLFFNYIIDSLEYPFGGEVSVAQWMDRVGIISGRSTDNIPDSTSLINVSFDKTLIDYEAPLYSTVEDSPKLPVGKITTTDRKKLLDFLLIAHIKNNYRFILLDIRFEDDIPNDEVSDSLFHLIKTMDNVVFANHEDTKINRNAPIEKSACGDYYTTFLVSDVVKYPVLQKKRDSIHLSIPAYIYSELNNHIFSNWGPLTFDNGNLCKRSIYPTYPIRLTNWAKPSGEDCEPVFLYLNLGEDILSSQDPSLVVQSVIDGKIVVIGDFNEDMHDTYIGLQPGSLVNINSYVALCNGEHLINWFETALSFILFFIITYCIIKGISIWQYVPLVRKSKNFIVKFVIAFVGFTVILTIYAIIVYLTFGTIFNVVIPSFYFAALDLCRKIIK